MPEHIRALIVILVFSVAAFIFAKKISYSWIDNRDFIRRRNIWIAITLIAFLSQNFWIYILVSGMVISISRRREANIVALFFILLFCVPSFAIKVPGFGSINYLFAMTHQRMLILVLLLPTFLILIGKSSTRPLGRTIPDLIFISYILFSAILEFREESLTNTFRKIFYIYIDAFIPYYVISRSLTTLPQFKEALFSFITATIILSLVGAFEAVKHWLLYNSLMESMGYYLSGQFSGYTGQRGGLLRATGSVGRIPLGYIMAISIGFYLFIRESITSRLWKHVGLFILLVGIFAPVSRGPWVGAVAIFMVFMATGRYAFLHLSKFFIASLIILGAFSMTPGGKKFVELLPFIGSSEQKNVTYRERLMENSLIVINRNPLFGSTDYLNTPEMESMRQGQGIIDVVNTYLGVALRQGYVGLGLFLGFFISICLGIYRALRVAGYKHKDEQLLGRALVSSLVGALVIIFTVSRISIIPTVYWSLAGMGVAYMMMIRQMKRDERIAEQEALFQKQSEITYQRKWQRASH